jgi:alginate O-acetyltransferase complex protein AlgI
MTFDSLDFLVFFAVLLTVWICIQGQKLQLRNAFLLFASYFFYGYWSPPFVGLIILSTLLDFYVARAITVTASPRTRKQLVTLSIVVNLCFLGFFKYFNFFIDSALMILPQNSAFSPTLEVILPVGISFYTFQTMSYTIDVYRRNIDASKSLLEFALYVTFFPQLVAGPIERAANMLPQFKRSAQITGERTLDGLDLCVLQESCYS